MELGVKPTTIEKNLRQLAEWLPEISRPLNQLSILVDGKRILFSWKKSDREDDYHLYEMEVATRKVRQLTDGLGFADYEGAYLPGGQHT